MVGGFFGGNEEQVIIRTVFRDDGVKEFKTTQKDLGNGQKRVSKWVKEGVKEWRKLETTVQRNAEHYKRLAKEARNAAQAVKAAKRMFIKRKHQGITDMGRSDIVRDSKGRETEGTRITKMTRGLDQFSSRVVSSETNIEKLSRGLERQTTVFKNYRGQVVKTTSNIKKQQEQFSMWALSFIFAGMQIKMVAQQIARSTTSTFLKIEQGQTDAGRSLIGLAANFKFLQFQIGQAIGTALKPLMPILTSIIRSVAQFVAQNPGKTFAAIAAAFTLGTGMFLGGQLVLFSDALIALIDKGGGLTKVMAPLAFLANPVVIGSILALVALSRVSWKAFGETPEAWEALKDSMTVLGGEDGPLANIADSMENLIQTIFPDFQLNWENIAWTVAWAGKIIVNQVAAIVDGLSMMGNLAAIAINSMKGIQAALMGNEEEAMKRQRAVDDARASITGSATNLRSPASSQAGLLAQGPMGFKEDTLRETNRDDDNARNFLEGGPKLLINANVVNMGSDGSVRGTGNDSLISRTT